MSLPTSPSIDPNGTLVQTLLGHGFTTAQISTAQEKLWISAGSGEGGYDDLNAVGEMLVTMYGGGGAGMEEASSSSEGSYETDSSYETDTDDEDEDERGLKEEQTASSSCTESKRNEPKNKTEKKNAAVPKSLSQKLQYVARDVPQLVDAIFALNAWTTKAASRGDLERYFLDIDAQKSQNKQQADPSTLIAGCANLITSVLLSSACNVNVASSNSSNVSNGVAHSSSMKKALGELLRRGRGVPL
eukprot:g13879.t1 g13879   contig9:656606-657532(-)